MGEHQLARVVLIVQPAWKLFAVSLGLYHRMIPFELIVSIKDLVRFLVLLLACYIDISYF
jgi:hypothetical protein